MKEFFKKVVTILYIIFVLILVAFTCGSTEKGNFDVVPACFLILFSCLGITYLIARHNTKKINKEHDKKEREEQAAKTAIPEWFDEEISKKITNSKMATQNIEKMKEEIGYEK